MKVKTLKELYGETSRREFLAWGLDLFMAFIVAELLSNFNGPYFVEKILDDYLFTFLAKAIGLWIVSVFINTPMLLLTGLSYGEYVAKLRLREKFIKGSLVSLTRFSLRFFLGPFTKLSIKLFKNKTPLDQGTSQSKLLYVIFIFTLLLCLIAPMARSLRYGGAINKKDQNFLIPVSKSSKVLEAESRLSSQRLHLVTKLEKSFFQNWALLPRFDLIKNDKDIIISSYLNILNKKTLESGYLERSRKINISKLLSKLFNAYVHLTNHNENLKQDILKDKDQKWSAASKEELKDLFDHSLTFGSSIKDQIILQLMNGPYSSGHLYLRSEIKKVIPLTKIKSFSFIKLKHHSFILFSGLYGKTKRLCFFSMEEKKPYIYSLSWQGSDKSKDQFMSTFFNNVSWEFSDDTSFWSYPSKISDITVTHIMDMLIEKKLSEEHQNALEVSLYMYYFKLYKEALVKENIKMRNLIIVELKKMNRIIKLKKNNLTPVFVARWNSLVANAISNNKKYFEVKK